MKKCWSFVCVPVILILLVSSCSLGLNPAKSGSTEVSFPVGDALKSRTIAPGTGYLYIRTVGGPTGDNGPFYGPYQLSAGSVFTTNEIPAGSYDGFGILYATEPLEELNTLFLDQPYSNQSFTQLMNLPDAEFKEFTDGDPQSPTPSNFDNLVDGRATGEMLKNVRILAGQRNVIAAKLMPIIGGNNLIDMNTNYLQIVSIQGNTTARSRRFFELDITLADVTPYNSLKFSYSFTTGEFFSSMIIYDQNGTVLGAKLVNSPGPVNGELEVPYNQQRTIYGYIDFISNETFMQIQLQP